MKTQDILLLGGLGLGAYFLIIKPLLEAPGKVAEGIASAPANAITGTENFLLAQSKGFSDLLSSLFGSMSSQYTGFQQSLVDVLKAQADTANRKAEANMPLTPQTQLYSFGTTPVVQTSGTLVKSVRFPTDVITAFATPQTTRPVSTPLGQQIKTSTPYGISATNSQGQVIATGFATLAQAKAYEVAVGVRR